MVGENWEKKRQCPGVGWGEKDVTHHNLWKVFQKLWKGKVIAENTKGRKGKREDVQEMLDTI